MKVMHEEAKVKTKSKTRQSQSDDLAAKVEAPEEMLNDPIKKMEQTLLERKKIQVDNMKTYDRDKEMIKAEIDDNQGTDIMEKILVEQSGF